ncbi:MAG TPA: TIR domain-containing protein [Thermoanaerobaculia bacterium]|nr:TIR domain-containing protein [Thermoanaerobaculia bacterium]
MQPKRLFISYAWESDDYKLWVKKLATRLREDGVDARLDAWDLRETDVISEFMNREIRQADWVLVLCSPAYQAKVRATEDGVRVSGVGWETRLLSGGVLVANEKKVIAALAQGTWEAAAPDALCGQPYCDLSDPAAFEIQYHKLLQEITGSTEKAPPLGKPPADLAPQPVEALRFPPAAAVPRDLAPAAPIEAPQGQPAAVAASIGAGGSGEVELRFTLRAAAKGGWDVELQVDGGAPTCARFEVDLASAGGQTARDLQLIRDNACTVDDIQNLGSELWTKLLGGKIEEQFDSARRECRARDDGVLKIRLALPAELEDLPWEAVWDFDEFSLSTSPLASVVRSPAGNQPAGDQPAVPRRPPGRASVKLLVVIPSGSGLGTSSEWEKIRQSAQGAGGKIEIECVDGLVTANRFADKLRQDWDIVHFIGHGRLDAQGRVELRLNAEAGEKVAETAGQKAGETAGEKVAETAGPKAGDTAVEDADWLSARVFAQQFLSHPPQLVVVNCCHGGSVGPQALSGLGSYLSRARVPATVVMRYAIHDSAAADFSAALYRELFTGKRPGRVDLAVQEGRATLERTYRDGERARSSITPALYLVPGAEQLFTLLDVEQPPAAGIAGMAAAPAIATIDRRIDRRLIHAIETRCCLPILGPGILAAGAQRLEADKVPPGLGSLAQRLAQASSFPGFERITPLADSVADWLTPVVFQRICQHFESFSEGERRSLNEVIKNSYGAFTPNAALEQIASWQVPGIVYTHVDGLLEQALRRLRGRDLQVVQAADLGAGLSPAGEVVLVNLRGSYAATSMVLTEEDEDRLSERLPAVAAFVADLMNRVGGCNLLFLGVSASDPLVRSLARRLLRDELARNRGTAFFISDQTTLADSSYWHQFQKLDWLEINADVVIAGLSAATRAAGRGPESPP